MTFDSTCECWPLNKWTNAEDMQDAVDAYFAACRDDERPATVTGLALALGFSSRAGLLRWETGESGKTLPDDVRTAIRYTVKRAKAYIEDQAETRLYQGKVNPVGTIFSLKNNFGWMDRSEDERGGGITIQIATFTPPAIEGTQDGVSVQSVALPDVKVALSGHDGAIEDEVGGSTNGSGE